MSVVLRKYFWVLNLLTIALCALFAANALGKLVESKLPRPKARRLSAPPPQLAQTMSGPVQRDITGILERNIFCSTCEKLTETPVEKAAEPGEAGSTATSAEPVKSSLSLKLVATLVAAEKKHSYAVLEDLTNNSSSSSSESDSESDIDFEADPSVGIIGIGETVPGSSGAVVSDILERRIYLLNNGQEEYIDLLETPNQATAQESPGSPSESVYGRRMPRPAPGLDEIAKGIQKVGEGKYEIERQALNKVLGNTTLLARSARIVPSVRNGKPNGFKLYAIRPGSLYSLLGMFNGDTINAINGHAMTTPDKALEIYTKLRNASHLTISFTRRGQSVSHEYTIR